MKRIYTCCAIAFVLFSLEACTPKIKYSQTVSISRDEMMDKLLGGWYGQAIGCAYGGPTEFKYAGAFIPDDIPLRRSCSGDRGVAVDRVNSCRTVPCVWYDGILSDNMVWNPGIYDDVYMDMAFVEVMAEHGVDAPVELFAQRFAHKSFPLWCANQNSRYNILQGVDPLQAGYWKNSPHAEDIDFQIEADFAGLVSPGMPVRSAEVGDNIGHMLNYGDGWYGGVFVAAMYSLAFVCDHVPTLVCEAAKMIPEGTKFRSCIDDVLKYWKKYPDDWHQCWLKVAKDYNHSIGNFEGLCTGWNINATVNSAYVAIGLLYGEGDFWKTVDIATRCGQDSDCNPATAAGILGTARGMSNMPLEWKNAAKHIESTPFPFSEWSLSELSDVTARLAAENLELALCGNFSDGFYNITIQEPSPVRYEKAFENLELVQKTFFNERGIFSDSLDLEFEGNSIVVAGKLQGTAPGEDYVARISAYLDGELVENVKMPCEFNERKTEIFWKYCFGSGKHTLRFEWENPVPGMKIHATGMAVYDSVAPAN